MSSHCDAGTARSWVSDWITPLCRGDLAADEMSFALNGRRARDDPAAAPVSAGKLGADRDRSPPSDISKWASTNELRIIYLMLNLYRG